MDLTSLGSWVSAHPEMWPIVSALLVTMLRPGSEADYARLASRRPPWFWSRWAAFTQLLGALGIDPQKASAALQKVVTGHVEPLSGQTNAGSGGHLTSGVLGPNGGGGPSLIPNREDFVVSTAMLLMRSAAERGEPIDDATEAKAKISAVEIYERATRSG